MVVRRGRHSTGRRGGGGLPVVIALALLVLAALAFVAASLLRMKAKAGALPEGVLVYRDTDRHHVAQALVSHSYQLIGKPDYVVETQDGPVPVEVKSRACGDSGPFPGEKAQLYAYCLLVEDETGEPVQSGVIEYANRKWAVPFGRQERAEIIGILAVMRALQRASGVERSHTSAGKCRNCGFNAPDVCGQALTPP